MQQNPESRDRAERSDRGDRQRPFRPRKRKGFRRRGEGGGERREREPRKPLPEDVPFSEAFQALGLSERTLKAVYDLGYENPTPVQELAVPEVLAGRDLLAAAQTGTGKTAAFLLPTMDKLERGGKGCHPSMLVVTPTRELAQQIDEHARTIARRTGHHTLTVVGGVSYNPQRSALRRGVDVLVATPGRLVDLINQDAAHLDNVQVLVLDEADRMLDMGFLPDVRKIVDLTPEERQTLLFSATLDDKAIGSIKDLVDDPARVEIVPEGTPAETVEQYVLPVATDAKNRVLEEVLKENGAQHTIVFVRTKRRADACVDRLKRAGISAEAIHGDRSQAQRQRALKAFRKGNVDVLVATDVLARGIDVQDVRYVVNFDIPEEPVDYIHRIGRTGRAGETGWAVTIVTHQDVREFFAIEKMMDKAAKLYDVEGLDVGDDVPYVDPERVPAEFVPGSGKKSKRGKGKGGRPSSRGAGRRRREGGRRDGERRGGERRSEGERREGERRSRVRDMTAADSAVERFGDEKPARSGATEGGAAAERRKRPNRLGRAERRERIEGAEHGSRERAARSEERSERRGEQGEERRGEHYQRSGRGGRAFGRNGGAGDRRSGGRFDRGGERRNDGGRPRRDNDRSGRNHDSGRNRAERRGNARHDEPFYSRVSRGGKRRPGDKGGRR